MKKILIYFIALLASSTTYAGIASGGSLTINFQVVNYCYISSVNGLSFGNYNSINGNTQIGSFNIACTSGVPYKISITPYPFSLGNNFIAQGDGTYVANRYMTNNDNTSNILNYEIYTDPSYSSVYCINPICGNSVNSIGNGTTQTSYFYGKIPAGQTPTPGNYSASNQIQIDF
jgi:spore coat protein U-like protein